MKWNRCCSHITDAPQIRLVESTRQRVHGMQGKRQITVLRGGRGAQEGPSDCATKEIAVLLGLFSSGVQSTAERFQTCVAIFMKPPPASVARSLPRCRSPRETLK